MRLGWLIPLAWVLKSGASGRIRDLLPVYAFVAVGVLAAAAWPQMERVAVSRRLHLPAALIAIVLAVLAGLIAELTGFLVGMTITPGSLILNSLLLIGVALVVAWLVQEGTYEDILRDVRFGIIALVFAIGFAYVALGSHQVMLGPAVYAGVVGYVLIAMFCLSLGRRMGEDEESKDKRSPTVEPDWILATIVLLLGLGLASLVLVQLIGVDVVGALGSLLQRPFSLFLAGLQSVGLAMGTVVTWITHLLGLQGLHGRHTIRVPHPPKGARHHGHVTRSKPHPTPAWVFTVLKAIGVLVVGIVALAFLVAMLRISGWLKVATLRGETRISQWSWRKMFSWALRHATKEAGRLKPDFPHHLHGPRRLRSVRDVYRAFLRLGASRTHPRRRGETGLEYSLDFQSRWPASADAVQELNELYEPERYSPRQSPPEAVDRARARLHDIELASRAPADTPS